MTEEKENLRLVINVEGKRVDVALTTPRSRSGHTLDPPSPPNPSRFSKSLEGNPVENLAPALRSVFEQAKISPGDIHCWIYSGGPGSLLGLRSLAMLLTTWEVAMRPELVRKFRFSGMVWAARELQAQHPGQSFTLISPWRTNAWNVLHATGEPVNEGALRVVEGEPVAEGEAFYCLRGERIRATFPNGCQPVGFPQFDTLFPHLDEPGFLVETPEIAPILSGTTEYKRWSPAASLP